MHRLLRDQGRTIGLRTVQHAVAPVRQAQRAADVATVRVETAPGAQMQVDFGEKRVTIAGTAVTVFLHPKSCVVPFLAPVPLCEGIQIRVLD